jgi:S1-C subfamily serine protease
VIPGRVDFTLEVNGPVYDWSYTLGDYAGFAIDTTLDDEWDYIILVDSALDGAYGVPVDVFDVNRERFVSACDAQAWISGDYLVSVDLVASCLPFGSSFGLTGFAYNYIFDSLDAVPDLAPFRVRFDGVSGGTPVSGTTQVVPNAPAISPATRYLVSNPGSNPSDLVKLSAKVTKSVVTVLCSNSQGSGWSAKVALSSQQQSRGIQSFIITNHHVVDGCLGSTVEIVNSTGTTYSGKVVGWDEETDVAAIETTASIPGLEWIGEKPAIGWWVGALGSPYGNSNTLSTGIISSVLDREFLTTAPLNPGNSGGPIFDREGRVLGVATAIRTGSNLIGFAGSTELMCEILVSCGTSNPWLDSSALSAAPQDTPFTEGSQGPSDGEFAYWTKVLANKTQMKFYIKYPQPGDKIQFMVQDSSGKYKQFAWMRIDPEDLDANGNYMGLTNDVYFIRTMNLKSGKNRVQIRVNGEIVWGTKTYSRRA